MAIWQIPIRLVSAQGGGVCFEKLAGTTELATILPEEKSWCEKIKQYGALDSTCVELYCSENIIEEISARIDLRNITKQQMEGICTFAAANGMWLVCGVQAYTPCVESFREIVAQSDAHRFLTDPQGFLDALDK